ncbi:MAG: hypothetical protein WD645_04285 [Dehalococcoidia bacterium]
MDLSTLQPGQPLFTERMAIATQASAAYREAVDDGCGLHAQERLVPSMAVAALVMAGAMRAVQLPAGAVHTGQELEFVREVAEGASLECSGSVGQNTVRQGARFLTLELRATCDGELVLHGRANISLQEPAGVQGPAGGNG